jgi:hypothetical protein
MEKWYLLKWLVDLCCALKPHRMEPGLNRKTAFIGNERK